MRIAGVGSTRESTGGNERDSDTRPTYDIEGSFPTLPGRPLDELSETGARSPRQKQGHRQRRIEGQRRAQATAQMQLGDNASHSPRRHNNPQMKLSASDQKKLRYGGFIRDMEISQRHRNPSGTWQGVRNKLDQMEQDLHVENRKGANQKVLHLPEETVALLAGMTRTSMKDNIWFVPIRNGCWVHVLDPREGDGVHRKIILSGSPHVMDLVEDMILRSREDQAKGDPLIEIQKPPFPIVTSRETMWRKNIPVPKFRAIWHFPPEYPRVKLDTFLESPTRIGNVREFNEYIEDLTATQGPSPPEMASGRSAVPYTQRIAQHLQELFQQESNHKLFSTAALNLALEFLCKNEHLNVARSVFLKAEHVATTDTYNIFLNSAARRQDVRTFRHFLNLMSRARLRPNSDTWLALLNAMVTPRQKTNLIRHMIENGYMTETLTIRTAHQLTVQDSLRVHLESGESIDTFISLMINTHGADWFGPSMISQMFGVTTSMKNFEATEQLLTICKQHRFTIKSVCLNQILPMCRANIFTAIKYVLACMSHPTFPGFSRETWELLFLMAFKQRHYNICRVVWRYACMNQTVTYKMQQAVWSSLVYSKPTTGLVRILDRIYHSNAGKFIVGIDSHLKNHHIWDSIAQILPVEYHHNPVQYLVSPPQPDGIDPQVRHELSKYLISRDITLGGSHYEPIHPLEIMLETAAIVDRSWRAQPRSMPGMMQKGVMVKIREKKPELV